MQLLISGVKITLPANPQHQQAIYRYAHRIATYCKLRQKQTALCQQYTQTLARQDCTAMLQNFDELYQLWGKFPQYIKTALIAHRGLNNDFTTH